MRPPARTGPAPVPPTWDAVRQWAADNGLDSAAALQRWLNATVRRGNDPSIDPRAAALLRALRQYSMAAPPGQPLVGVHVLPIIYSRLLTALSDPLVGSGRPDTPGGPRPYPPGIDGPEWIRPLVDPLAEGGRLWPPSPVTVLTRMSEVASRALGYAPVDSDAMVLGLAEHGAGPRGGRVADTLGAYLPQFGQDIARAARMLSGLRTDAAAPRLASDAAINESRIRWPIVTPAALVMPYLFIVARGLAQDARGGWTPADGPVHVALLVNGGSVLGRLVVSDTTGEVIDTDGTFGRSATRRDSRSSWLPAASWVDEATGGNAQLVVDLLMPFIDAAREGQPDAVGMAPTAGDYYSFLRDSESVGQPLLARAFEGAEVMAALSAARRAAAAAAIDEATATATAGGLANLAARAYRGDIISANVPEEVRQLVAARAIAKACAPDATPQDRARVPGAAHVLGLSGAVGRQDLAAVCDASVDVARRLYGRA